MVRNAMLIATILLIAVSTITHRAGAVRKMVRGVRRSQPVLITTGIATPLRRSVPLHTA